MTVFSPAKKVGYGTLTNEVLIYKLSYYLLIFHLLVLVFLGANTFLTSLYEKEKRAQNISFVGTLAITVFLVLMFFKVITIPPLITVIIAAGLSLAWIAVLIPSGINPKALEGTNAHIVGEVKKIDQRDTAIERHSLLYPGMEQYKEYYSRHPELEEGDNQRRNSRGMVDIYNPVNWSAVLASIKITHCLSRDEDVEPPVAGNQVAIEAGDLTERAKSMARFLGADLVGVAEMNPLWVYTHRAQIYHGNWEDWGRGNENNHRYALVIGIEIPWETTVAAPHTTSLVGVSETYSRLAKISVQMATFFASIGYPARAHNLRNYQVLCVPLAIDAGLAELGRSGYGITKEFGPRVKWAVVTTDAPLVPDKPIDIGVEDFCERCKKCARACPTRSITLGEKTVYNGIRRWLVEADSCYGYWSKLSTDCGVCLVSCPWSHPRTLAHRLGAWMASRSVLARIGLNIVEGIMYDDRSAKNTGPHWIRYDVETNKFN